MLHHDVRLINLFYKYMMNMISRYYIYEVMGYGNDVRALLLATNNKSSHHYYHLLAQRKLKQTVNPENERNQIPRMLGQINDLIKTACCKKRWWNISMRVMSLHENNCVIAWESYSEYMRKKTFNYMKLSTKTHLILNANRWFGRNQMTVRKKIVYKRSHVKWF